MKKATLIYNPVAGRNPPKRERQIREACEVLKRAGIDAKLARTVGPGSATILGRVAAAEGDGLVIACGGDGTINEVINGISPGRMILGILPGGTANIIANELKLPHNPIDAARQLPSWKPRRIGLGYAAGRSISSANSPETIHRYFLSVAGVGYDAYVIHRLTFDFKMSLGVAAYLLEGAKQVMHYSFPVLTCRTDGREIAATFAVVQRTSRYAGWFRTAPSQSIIKPHFGVSLYKSRRRLRYFLYGAAVVTQRNLRDVERLESRKVDFSAEDFEKDVYFELDGELAGVLPVSFEVTPDALSLLMP
ncbi:MAG: diacylglycerol/lipid kinase family protein [Terriglobia bacterium]